jgi:hypothetical protein
MGLRVITGGEGVRQIGISPRLKKNKKHLNNQYLASLPVSRRIILYQEISSLLMDGMMDKMMMDR